MIGSVEVGKCADFAVLDEDPFARRARRLKDVAGARHGAWRATCFALTRRLTLPLTILGGFLGAGKTTALNRLLRTATERIAVLVNDFGAINVDAGLIAASGAT